MKKINLMLGVKCVSEFADDRAHTVVVIIDEDKLKQIKSAQSVLSSVQGASRIVLIDSSPRWYDNLADGDTLETLFDEGEEVKRSSIEDPVLCVSDSKVWWSCSPKHCGEEYLVKSERVDILDLELHLARGEDYADVA